MKQDTIDNPAKKTNQINPNEISVACNKLPSSRIGNALMHLRLIYMLNIKYYVQPYELL